jgi:hypothetical protein
LWNSDTDKYSKVFTIFTNALDSNFDSIIQCKLDSIFGKLGFTAAAQTQNRAVDLATDISAALTYHHCIYPTRVHGTAAGFAGYLPSLAMVEPPARWDSLWYSQ